MNRSTWRKIGIGLLVLGALMVVAWVGGVVRDGSSLYRHLRRTRSLADVGPARMDPQAVGDLIVGVRSDVVSLKRRAGWLAPLGPLFRWVPQVGPLLDQAPAFVSLTDAGTELAVLFWKDVAPAASRAEGLGPALIRESLPRLSDRLVEKRSAAEALRDAYASVECAVLPDAYRTLCKRADPWIDLLPDLMPVFESLPELAGLHEPQTYLLLALNEDELRPGGGFISGVGEIRVENGAISALDFRDSYAVDDYSQPYPAPPWPLRQFMNLDLWVFRDSNWSPDFTEAVENALPLYRPGYEVDVDGVIAADQRAVRVIVEAVGPLNLPDADEPVDGENVIAYMHRAWAPEERELSRGWWRERKSFMGDLAAAMMNRIRSGNVEWGALAESGLALLKSRDLQVVLFDPRARAFLADQGWDGRLSRGEGDYLMVAEANVGYNKASGKLDRGLRYEVDLTSDPVQVALQMTYTHTSQVDIDCVPESRYDLDYVAMMDRCYWGFVRVHTPAGAQLIRASEHPIPAERVSSGEAWPGRATISSTRASGDAFAVFSQAMLLPTASREVLTFVYQLPDAVRSTDEAGRQVYRLRIQKQAGVAAMPARVLLQMPENAIVSGMAPDSCQASGVMLVCDLELSEDRLVEVWYEMSEGSRP